MTGILKKPKLHVNYAYAYDGVQFFLTAEVNGKRVIAKEIVWEEVDHGIQYDPLFVVGLEHRGFFQDLIDDIKRAGIKVDVSHDATDALKNHLEDMRRLVFNKND